MKSQTIDKIIVETSSGKMCSHCRVHSYPVDPDDNDLTGVDGDWVDDVINHTPDCIYFDLVKLDKLDESYKDAGTPCGNTKCSWNDKKWEANCGAESPDGDPYIAICMEYKRDGAEK